MNIKYGVLGWAILFSILFRFASYAAESENDILKTAVAPQWHNLNHVDIIPCPKFFHLAEEGIPVDRNLAIVVGSPASERTRTAAEDLCNYFAENISVDVPILSEMDDIKGKNLIVLGTENESQMIREYIRKEHVDFGQAEQQGYAIFPVTSPSKSLHLVLAGKDEQGVYWAAMTLTYLVKNNVIQCARILDWPDFKNRVCETLNQAVTVLFKNISKGEAAINTNWKLVENAVQEASRLKFNYIRCYSQYIDPENCYPAGDKAKILGQISDYVNKRGIKLYLNLYAGVGAVGEEKCCPELNNCLVYDKRYYTWSNDALIERACDKITEMARIIGPQLYYFHSPDLPDMGWNRRSAEDRERWGDNRIDAEAYLLGKFNAALQNGANGAGFSYVTNPYSIGTASGSDTYQKKLEMVGALAEKLPENIDIQWREGSLESAINHRRKTNRRSQQYYIENSSFHKNRLVGGTARTAKTFYFHNGDNDFFYDNSNTSSRPLHKQQNYILAEYSWNTQAPGAAFIRQVEAQTEGQGHYTGMLVEDIPWGEWMTVQDLDGPVCEELLPRACRLFFGPDVGDTLAMAYSVGGSVSDNSLGGWWTTAFDRRYRHSTEFAEQLSLAYDKMILLWQQPERFHHGTYPIYLIALKYVSIYRHIEKINAFLMNLSWIAETGAQCTSQDTEEIFADAMHYAKQAKEHIRCDYERFGLDKIEYKAIYGAQVDDYNNICKKIDDLCSAMAFKAKQIALFGAGNIKSEKRVIGIVPATSTVQIDGDLREWDISKANILDKSDYNRKVGMKGISGHNDIIAYWNTAWDKNYVYVATWIFDDCLSFAHNEQMYRNDAVELWINEQQFIFSFNDEGKFAVEPYGNYDLHKVQFAARISDQAHELHPKLKFWMLEIKIPIDIIGCEPFLGNSFDFALGVDDVDAGEDNSQLFYPSTYSYKNTKSFAKAFLHQKAEISVDLASFRVGSSALLDGTFTTVDMELSINCQSKVHGISAELVIDDNEGSHRCAVGTPEAIDGNWKGMLNVVADNLYGADAEMTLVVRAPGTIKKISLRKGTTGLNSGPISDPSNMSMHTERTTLSVLPEALWIADFDQENINLSGHDGGSIAPTFMEKCEFSTGIKGNGMGFTGNGALGYGLSHRPVAGYNGIDFWLYPNYSETDNFRRTFVRLAFSVGELRFFKNANYGYIFVLSANGKYESLSAKIHDIKINSWNHISLTWDTTRQNMSLKINGVEQGKEKMSAAIFSELKTVIIGNFNEDGMECCESIIDEIKIHGF